MAENQYVDFAVNRSWVKQWKYWIWGTGRDVQVEVILRKQFGNHLLVDGNWRYGTYHGHSLGFQSPHNGSPALSQPHCNGESSHDCTLWLLPSRPQLTRWGEGTLPKLNQAIWNWNQKSPASVRLMVIKDINLVCGFSRHVPTCRGKKQRKPVYQKREHIQTSIEMRTKKCFCLFLVLWPLVRFIPDT